MENKLETLKELYSNSTDKIFILDYKFKLLWCKKKEKGSNITGRTLKKMFNDYEMPLKSGSYCLNIDGMEHSCILINYAQQELYVLQISSDNAICAALNLKSVKGFYSNQSARIRDAVTYISFASTSLKLNLRSKDIDSINQLNIIRGNCFKLLKVADNTSELINYTEGDFEVEDIYLLKFLKAFVESSKVALDNQIMVHLNTEPIPNLIVTLNPERFLVCMTSLVVYTVKKNPDTYDIIIDAKIKEDRISLTVSVKADKEIKDKINKTRLLSTFIPVYADDSANADLLIIQKFCEINNIEFSQTCDSESGFTACTLDIPCSESINNNVSFENPKAPYYEGSFSPTCIAYSDIADIY